MNIKVGVSNRHVHLTRDNIITLFGVPLEVDRELLQPSEYASKSYVTLKTDKGIIDHVRVLGPERSYNQVEISKTDAYKLGLNPPIRTSGDVSNSSPITLIGPNGTIDLNEGCIIANRHIHINKEERTRLGLENVNQVKILIASEKGGMLDKVFLKESENFVLELHLDTDDANAFLIKTGDEVTIIK